MKKSIIMATLGLVMASTASAATGSEFFFQPGAGNSALSLGVNINSSTAKLSGLITSETKLTSNPIFVKYAYGLDADMSVAVSTDFGTEESDTSGSKEKSTGLNDLTGEFLMKSGSLYYGANATVALAKKKEATTTVDGNRSSGGYSLTPFVGYMGAMGFGGKLSYQYLMDRTVETTTTDKTVTGGSVLSLEGFWEMNYGSGIFGAKIAYAQSAEATTKQTGTTDSKFPSFSMYDVGAYVAHDITTNGTLLASFDYVNVPEFDYTSGVKVSSTGSIFSLGYRMGF